MNSEILNNNIISNALLDFIPAGVMIIDEKQKIRYVNSQLTEIFGIKNKDFSLNKLDNSLKCINFSSDFGTCDKLDICKICSLLKPNIALMNTKQKNTSHIVLYNGDNTINKELLITSKTLRMESETFALVMVEDVSKVSHLRQQLHKNNENMGIWGNDPQIIELCKTIKLLAQVNFPVLIYEESGTGKELVARAIHNQGLGKQKPFIPVNCGAIPDTLLESELFGYVKGAFTGALHDRKGRFAIADGGTLFLDEIGDISPSMQVKLLRVIQEGTFERLGDEKTQSVKIRIICATNKDLKKEIEMARFRQDLYYRINVFPVTIPPLRDRKNDIPIISNYLINMLSTFNNKKPGISTDALKCLMEFDWPGNIRELENALKYAIVNCHGDEILLNHLPDNIIENMPGLSKNRKRTRKRKLDKTDVLNALEEMQWNKLATAKRLRVSRATLYRFIDYHDINK